MNEWQRHVNRDAIEVERAFEKPQKVREAILHGTFTTLTNPLDDVRYPGINVYVPTWVQVEMKERIEGVLSTPIAVSHIFARETSDRTGGSHERVHSDLLMADGSAHVYLSLEWAEGAGTQFWEHATEGRRHVIGHEEVLKPDMSDMSKWTRGPLAQGGFNRMVIHDASLFHSAEPFVGWGSSPWDGRLVLTMFFAMKG